ncbi:MAG TPA: hypothetical protein PKE30_15770 [Niabella sp.]|nr:hypothetical protein [Niabella sp.]
MKKNILLLTALTMLTIVSCRKIEVDGVTTIIDGGNGGTGNGATVTLSGRITQDVTLKKGDNNILKGKVYVTSGATLTIEKGATVKGNYTGSDVAVLVVTRGAKIIADGTQEEPIIFTTSSPSPQSGDWGGIVLCGKAAVNSSYNGTNGLFQVEGEIDNANGDGLAGSGDAVAPAPVNDDNSGILRYVRIEYAGYAFQPDKEVNSLTMAAVGSGTTIDHVQVTYAKDDAFEWFGGSVNCKYLIAYKTQDDDFDSDNGYSGSVQFGLIVRDSAIADISKSEAFESDNNSSGSAATPQTSAVFCNISAFGPSAKLTSVPNSNYLGAAVQIRRNSSISIFNSAFAGWPVGIQINGSQGNTDLNIQAGKSKLSGLLIAGATKKAIEFVPGTGSAYTEASLTTWFTSNPKNKILATVDDIRYTRPFDYTNPDWQPFGNSPVVIPSASNDYFDDPIIKARPFITKVDFIGGIAPSGADANWHKGWTRFN